VRLSEQLPAHGSRAQARLVYAIVAGLQLVGNAELKLHTENEGEISYVIHPNFWGRRLATDAADREIANC